MLKFNPNYSLAVQLNSSDDTLRIQPPFTIEFDITRNTLSSANEATIRIYNLNEKNRAELRKDQDDQGRRKDISLIAGYGNSMAIIMSGQVMQAWSERQGVDVVTEIRCFDGGYGFANSQMALQFAKGTPRQVIVEEMVRTLSQHGINRGAVTEFPGTIPRGNSYVGATIDELRRLTEGQMFVDNGLLYVLGRDEVVDDAVIVIDPNSGLLGTPRRENHFVNVDMIFDPRFSLGRQVEIRDVTDDSFSSPKFTGKGLLNSSLNDRYKVVGIHHRGMISQTVGAPITTNLQLLVGSKALTVIPSARSANG